MRIETAHIKSNVIYTAILIHTVIIAAAPALSVMGILYLDSKTHRRKNMDDSMFFENANLTTGIIGFSIIFITIVSLVIYFRNNKKRFIVGVDFDDQLKKVDLFYKGYYNNRIKTVEVKYDQLSYSYANQEPPSVGGVSTSDLMIDKKIQIMNGKIYAGEISMGGTFWNKEGGKIKMILDKINSVKGSSIK